MEAAIETVKIPEQLISFIAGIALGRLIYILIIYLWSELSDRITIRKIHKYYDNMHPGDVFEFPKKDYNSLSIRASATMLKEAFGKAYSVSAKDPEKIVVTRVS